jgi:hypothetical protein
MPAFFVYDMLTSTSSPMRYDPTAISELGAINKERIAWVEYQVDANDLRYDTQVVLRTDCGASPEITDLSLNMNILAGRSTTLRVSAAGDQPINYAWYQGLSGDTSQPVGLNSPTFETPPLFATAAYWVRAGNHFGAVDSRTITLTVGETAELVIDGGFEQNWFEFWKIDEWFYKNCFEPSNVHTGQCALTIQASENGKVPNKARQIFLPVPYKLGDILTLSAWIKAEKVIAEDAAVMLKIRYADDTKDKVVIKPTQKQFEYLHFTAEPLTIQGKVTKAQVVVKYSNIKGLWWIDDVSVLHQPGNLAVIPLP